MRSSSVLAALCLPCLAFAQSSLTVSVSGTTAFKATDCGSQLSVTYAGTLATGACNLTPLQIFVTTAASCSTTGPSDAGTDEVSVIDPATFQATPSGTAQVPISGLPIFSGADGGSCSSSFQIQGVMQVCGHYSDSTSGLGGACNNTNTDVNAAAPVQIVYDSQPPTPPTLGAGAVSGIDSALTVSASNLDVTNASLDTSSVNFYYRPFDAGTPFVFGSSAQNNGGTSVGGTISGLQNGVTYEVEATAVDPAGNESLFSDTQTGIPQPTYGFWSHYQSAGGAEKGGCTAAGGGLGLLALLPAAYALRRRDRS